MTGGTGDAMIDLRNTKEKEGDKMYYRVNVAELKKAMIDSGFSKVKALSQATGIDRNTLGKILNEKAIPSSRAMYALVSTLNLSYEKAGEIFFSRNLRVA